jgi:YjbE family integral membrane protein
MKLPDGNARTATDGQEEKKSATEGAPVRHTSILAKGAAAGYHGAYLFAMFDLHPRFFLDALSIILIDILLAGDNAVVIAMAVRSLPPEQRRLGIIIGSAFAVVLRIGLTFFAAQLLLTQFLKLAGGVAILWIAVKLLADSGIGEEGGQEAKTLWQAMWLIIVADITMSVDNILAVAAASKGSLGLLIFGLGLSIPFVVFTSRLLSTLMDKYPAIVYLGSAILGRVGGEMILTDPWVAKMFPVPHWAVIAAEVVCAAGVVAIGWWLLQQRRGNKIPGHSVS